MYQRKLEKGASVVLILQSICQRVCFIKTRVKHP